METLEEIAVWLVEFVHHFGYVGIFVMTFLESTFVPIPSEVTMVPAGYLVQQDKMNLWIVFFISVVGSIAGSLANYYIAYHYGRRFLYAYGKYMLFNHDKMAKLDKFFENHGEISTLTGRLIPGLRHVISFPAGLAHMNLRTFTVYTGVGSSVWMATLICIGYLIGGNEDMVKRYVRLVSIWAVSGVVAMVAIYIWYHRRKTKNLVKEKV